MSDDPRSWYYTPKKTSQPPSSGTNVTPTQGATTASSTAVTTTSSPQKRLHKSRSPTPKGRQSPLPPKHPTPQPTPLPMQGSRPKTEVLNKYAGILQGPEGSGFPLAMSAASPVPQVPEAKSPGRKLVKSPPPKK